MKNEFWIQSYEIINVFWLLEGFRRATGVLSDVSFDTISGAGSNGAIVHYRVTRSTNRTINKGEMFEMLMSTYGMCGYPTEPVLFTGLVALSNEYKRGR